MNIETLVKNLEKNQFEVHTFATKEEAKEELLNRINNEDTVAFGGSMSLLQMDVYDDIKEKAKEIYWHWKKDVENPLVKAKSADVYVTSTNAITMDGKLVNIDGNGNRVAAMAFGHRDVYVMVGKNKIAEDYDGAIDRIKNVAAPLNAKRLNVKTPCVVTGKCADCSSPERICRTETIISKKPATTNMRIFLIDEELGY